MSVVFSPPSHILLLGVAGSLYNQVITISGETPPYGVIIQGRIPGITISVQNESIILNGTPKIMGTFTFTIIVIDSNNLTKNQTYKIRFELTKFADDLEEIRENAINLKNNYNDDIYELLFYDFKTARFNLSQIPDPITHDLIKSIIDGLFDIVDSPYIALNDSLEIVITTLPSTIRFIRGLS